MLWRLYFSHARQQVWIDNYIDVFIILNCSRYTYRLLHSYSIVFQLGDLLIKPIQRIQKYHLLVKKILSYTENANAPANVIASLRDAELCTSIIPKNANDMMDVGRLQGFTVRFNLLFIQLNILLCVKLYSILPCILYDFACVIFMWLKYYYISCECMFFLRLWYFQQWM